MLLIRFLLVCAAFGFVATAASLIIRDIYLTFELDRILRRSPNAAASPEAGEPSSPALPRPRRTIRINARDGKYLFANCRRNRRERA